MERDEMMMGETTTHTVQREAESECVAVDGCHSLLSRLYLCVLDIARHCVRMNRADRHTGGSVCLEQGATAKDQN